MVLRLTPQKVAEASRRLRGQALAVRSASSGGGPASSAGSLPTAGSEQGRRLAGLHARFAETQLAGRTALAGDLDDLADAMVSAMADHQAADEGAGSAFVALGGA